MSTYHCSNYFTQRTLPEDIVSVPSCQIQYILDIWLFFVDVYFVIIQNVFHELCESFSSS